MSFLEICFSFETFEVNSVLLLPYSIFQRLYFYHRRNMQMHCMWFTMDIVCMSLFDMSCPQIPEKKMHTLIFEWGVNTVVCFTGLESEQGCCSSCYLIICMYVQAHSSSARVLVSLTVLECDDHLRPTTLEGIILSRPHFHVHCPFSPINKIGEWKTSALMCNIPGISSVPIECLWCGTPPPVLLHKY